MNIPMNFEDTWTYLMGKDLPATPEMEALRGLALGFYKAGETQGVANCDRIVGSAIAEANAREKAKRGAPQ